MTPEQQLFENAYIETKEYLATREGKLVDADVMGVEAELHINLVAGALQYVQKYGGTNNFILDLKSALVRKGKLSVPQIRAALNCMKVEINTGKIEVIKRTGEVEPVAVTAVKAQGAQAGPGPILRDRPPTYEPRVECFTCHEKFHTTAEVVEHKRIAHTKAVMDETKVEKTFLDISALPDGRYAAFNPKALAGDSKVKDEDQYLFFKVRTLTRPVTRDRRYVYGRRVTGREYIPAGTIEVRLHSSDSKELIGMQKPGEGYDGQYADQLIEVMGAPKIFALIFAKFIGSCAICGRTLTDDDVASGREGSSRELGIGPECEKKYGRDYWKKFKRIPVVA